MLRRTDGHGRYKDEFDDKEKDRSEKGPQEEGGKKSQGETQEKRCSSEEGFRHQEKGRGEEAGRKKIEGEEKAGQGQEEIAIPFSGGSHTGCIRRPRFSLFGRGAGFLLLRGCRPCPVHAVFCGGVRGGGRMNVLVAAPHPDDDVIGCGGSIIRHIREGHAVTVVYMTDGAAGGIHFPKDGLAKRREKEARASARLLGVKDLIFLRYPDGDLACDRETLNRVVVLIRAKKPGIVYFPHGREAHRDHRKTHELFTEAVRRAAGPWFGESGGDPWRVDTILCYEIWTPLPHISYVEDVTDFMTRKLKALKKHASQLGEISYDEAVEGLNRFRGVTTGRGKYCECFEVMRTGRI